MYTLISAVTLGLAALTATAHPLAERNEIQAEVAAVIATWNDASPLPFADGFPSPSPEQLPAIFQTAHGTLSNGSAPANISADGLNSLRLVNFAETVESVFFSQLLYNVTHNVTGFEVPKHVDREYFINFINVTKADEELHALDAGGALAAVGAAPFTPCGTYNFPVSTLDEALMVAITLTSNVFGVIGDIATVFAQNGEIGFIRHLISIVAQEGEQNGFFRYMLGKVPDELPFTTPSTRDFAFTGIQGFVDPSSCPDLNLITLKKFQPLAVLDTPGPKTQNITFGVPSSQYNSNSTYNVVYTNQLNNPVVLPTTFVSADSTTTIVSATFPYDEHLMNGLTIAVITDQPGPFADVTAVNAAAIFAPGFIIVN